MIVNEGAPTPKISKVFPEQIHVVSETIANPASADDYWTPERLASAYPAKMPNPSDALDIPILRLSVRFPQMAATSPRQRTAFPQRVHGESSFRSA